MSKYTQEDQIMEVDALIGHIRQLEGYVDASGTPKLVKVEKGFAATLWHGSDNLGAFLVFDKLRICIRPYYYDEYEGGAVYTEHTHHVPLAYEHLSVEQRVEIFNKKSKEYYDKAIEQGFKLKAKYEIKDLKPFKMTNAAGKKYS